MNTELAIQVPTMAITMGAFSTIKRVILSFKSMQVRLKQATMRHLYLKRKKTNTLIMGWEMMKMNCLIM